MVSIIKANKQKNNKKELKKIQANLEGKFFIHVCYIIMRNRSFHPAKFQTFFEIELN